MPRPRVLIADDHALLLAAFGKLLADHCEVVGQVSDGRALVDAAERLRPDVIVLDIAMPLLNGLDAGRQIKQKLREVRLVFLTMNEDPALAAEAFRAGASAYLLKRSAGSELLTALEEVMRGRSYVTPLVTGGMVEALLDHGKGPQPRPDAASRRLRLLAEDVDEGGRDRAEPGAADDRLHINDEAAWHPVTATHQYAVQHIV